MTKSDNPQVASLAAIVRRSPAGEKFQFPTSWPCFAVHAPEIAMLIANSHSIARRSKIPESVKVLRISQTPNHCGFGHLSW
jgi:hypothetical protein